MLETNHSVNHPIFRPSGTPLPESMDTDSTVDMVGANENVSNTVVVETSSQMQPITQPPKWVWIIWSNILILLMLEMEYAGLGGQTTCIVVSELIPSTWVKSSPRYDLKCEYILCNL